MAKAAAGPKGKTKPTPVWLDDEQIAWLKTKPNGISGTVRNLVFEAMNLDNLAKSVRRKGRSQKPEARRKR